MQPMQGNNLISGGIEQRCKQTPNAVGNTPTHWIPKAPFPLGIAGWARKPSGPSLNIEINDESISMACLYDLPVV